MIVGRLYLAHIFVNIGEDKGYVCGKYVKKAVVYHETRDRYIDLFTDEIYEVNVFDTYEGEMYINLKYSLVPLSSFKCLNMGVHEDLTEDKIKTKILSTNLLK